MSDRAFAVMMSVALLPCALAGAAGAVDTSKLPASVDRPIEDVQPIFATSCYGCHGPDKHKSGYRLDVKSIALKGGDMGGAIVPGKGAASPLIHYVAGIDDDTVMPPKGERLSAEQIGILRAWIDQGATWPDDADATRVKDKADHWAFKPVTRPAVPQVDGVSHPNRRVHPRAPRAGEAEPIRAGRPAHAHSPTDLRPDRLPADAGGGRRIPRRWISPDAYERLVDRLLASAATTSWLASGGIKGGVSYGESDEWSFKAAVKPTYCYDLHATVLHPLRIDHSKLTFRHNGIDRRLTDVHGEVIRDIIA